MANQNLSSGRKGGNSRGICRKQRDAEGGSWTSTNDGPARVHEVEVMAGHPISNQDDDKARGHVEGEHFDGLEQQ